MNPRLAELVERSLERSLDAAEDAELARLLAIPQARAEAVAQRRQALLLKAALATFAADQVRAAEGDRRTGNPPRSPRRVPLALTNWRPWLVAAGIAVAALAAVSIVGRGHGELATLTEAVAASPAAGTSLYRGDRIVTDVSGHAVLVLRDGHRLRMAQNTALVLLPPRDGAAVRLDRGEIDVDVAAAGGGRLAIVTADVTADATAAVVGTRFTLAAHDGHTVLTVASGLVRLTRTRDGASTLIGAGEAADTALKDLKKAADDTALATVPSKTFTYDLVKDFGARPGDVAATTKALRAFNDEAQKRTRPPDGDYPGYPGFYPDADRNSTIVLNIPAGDFIHAWNQFGMNISRLKIVGAGSGLKGSAATTLRNLADGSWYDQLAFRSPLDYFGDPASNDYGYLIDTAAAGATRVKLREDPAAARHFRAGRWVLVYSYSQQQFGYPPNMRYYDWAKVASVDIVSGTIALDQPLRSTHRADRPYYGSLAARRSTGDPHGVVGPARIAAIDSAEKPVGEYHEYRGLHVLGNPHWDAAAFGEQAGSDIWMVGGLVDGAMADMWIEHAVQFQMIRSFRAADSTWSTDVSGKIVGSLLYERCDVGCALDHSGQLMWHVTGGHIGHVKTAARSAWFEHVMIDAMTGPSDAYANSGINLDAGNSVDEVILDQVNFVGNGNTQNPPIYAGSLDPITFIIDGSIISLPNGPGSSRLKIRKTSSIDRVPWQMIVDYWGEGHAVLKNAAIVPAATVALITGDSAFIYVDIAGATFSIGDTVCGVSAQKLTVTNCVSRNTGFDWSAPWPSLQVIPDLTWTDNAVSASPRP